MVPYASAASTRIKLFAINISELGVAMATNLEFDKEHTGEGCSPRAPPSHPPRPPSARVRTDR